MLDTFRATALSLEPQLTGLRSLWIGLNDVEREGTFVWSSGAPVTYTNWAPGEPAGGRLDENYVGMVVDPGFATPGQWHDIVSDFRYNDVTFGVVKITPLAAVPEPSALALAGFGLAGLLCSGLARRKVAPSGKPA